ncbi:MAG TPA: hypothetical protein VET84_05530 [Stellaceae bacterium]|nr:hypothetical protein [Stellaceae bacterium]
MFAYNIPSHSPRSLAVSRRLAWFKRPVNLLLVLGIAVFLQTAAAVLDALSR